MASTRSLIALPPRHGAQRAKPLELEHKLEYKVAVGWDASGGFPVSQKAANRVAGLCAFTEPILDTVVFELDQSGLLERIVGAYDLDKTAVRRARLLRHHHAIERALLLANTGQPDH